MQRIVKSEDIFREDDLK